MQLPFAVSIMCILNSAGAFPKGAREADVIVGVTNRVESVPPTADIIVNVRKRSGRYWEPWELNNNICPPSLCLASDEIRPRGTGGTVFYNGDIVLDREAERLIYGNDPFRLRFRRATSRSRSRLWKHGIVPFTWASEISPKSKRVLKKAMKHIKQNTCIKFRPKKVKDEDYIRFISEPGCWSNIGKVGGEQKVSIGRGCERIGTAIHEVSHALGLWHEQSRPDRDNYVEILEDNVSPRYLPDFSKINVTVATSRGFPYDYESVMHYSEKAFSNFGDKTIKVIGAGKKLGLRIGQRDGLSTLDIAQLRDMYYCNNKEDNNVTYCPDGWLKEGRSCYRFESKLKYQFSSAWKHCEKKNSKLLHIESRTEDTFIKKYLKRKYPDVPVWRTGGRVVNGTFVWYTGGKDKKIKYTAWNNGHPSSYSSMVLVNDKSSGRVNWEGSWLGSFNQMPEYAYPFVCERRSKRKCITLEHSDGQNYNGTLDHTIDGITCQKWSSQYPHQHKLLPYPYTEGDTKRSDGLGDHNYCRNPSGKKRNRPWCFTGKSSVDWQYCDITACSKPKKVVHLNSNQNDREIVDNVISGHVTKKPSRGGNDQSNGKPGTGPTRGSNNSPLANSNSGHPTQRPSADKPGVNTKKGDIKPSAASDTNNNNKGNSSKENNRKHSNRGNKSSRQADNDKRSKRKNRRLKNGRRNRHRSRKGE